MLCFLLSEYPENIHLSGISLLESTQYAYIGEVQYQPSARSPNHNRPSYIQIFNLC